MCSFGRHQPLDLTTSYLNASYWNALSLNVAQFLVSKILADVNCSKTTQEKMQYKNVINKGCEMHAKILKCSFWYFLKKILADLG